MITGTFWTVRFSTGGLGNRYATRKEAQQYADAANRYSELHRGERIISGLVRYVNYELKQEVSANVPL